jgi:hypothetical protein
MTVWTPKEGKAGVKSHWAPTKTGGWKESNILVYSTQIKQVKVVHLENVYRYMHHYLVEEGWRSFYGDQWFEEFYGEGRDSEEHKEIRWWWRVQKSPGGIGGSHQYFRQRVFIDALTTNMKRIEIMYKGKKIKPYIGELIIWFNSILELDINNWFTDPKKNKGGNWLLHVLEDFFPRMIYKHRIREQEIELRRFSERFVEDLKHFIGLRRVADFREPLSQERQWF